jgi:phosphate uptake regulator
MEFRNIVKSGNTSYVVSLPRRWVLKNGLEKGSVVSIIENGDSSLTINPGVRESEKPARKHFINLDDMTPETLRRQIVSCYINRISILTISGKNIHQHLGMIKEALEELIAFEIMEVGNDRIVIRDCLDIKEMKADEIIRKMDLNIREMFSVVLEIMDGKQKEISGYDSLKSMDRNLNRLNFLCEKIAREALESPALANSLGLSPIQSVMVMNTSSTLENIGDNLKNLAGHLLQRVSGEEKIFIRKQFFLCFENYKKAMEAYFKVDKDSANSVSDEKHLLRERNSEFLEKNNKLSVPAVRILERIQMIESMIGVLMRTIIDIA